MVEQYNPLGTSSESMSTRHISAALQNYEAARSQFFVFEVDFAHPETGKANLLKPEYSGDPKAATEDDFIQNAEEPLRLNVTKATVPHFTVGVESYRRGNDIVKFATVPE
jgi:hypothetical protein